MAGSQRSMRDASILLIATACSAASAVLLAAPASPARAAAVASKYFRMQSPSLNFN
jgi:hypothetical protein